MSAAPSPVHDVGLQSERTSLSWYRSGLSFAGVGALLLHTGGFSHPLSELPGIAALVVAAAIMGAAHLRYRSTGRSLARDDNPLPALWLPTVMTVALIALAGAALVVVSDIP